MCANRLPNECEVGIFLNMFLFDWDIIESQHYTDSKITSTAKTDGTMTLSIRYW